GGWVYTASSKHPDCSELNEKASVYGGNVRGAWAERPSYHNQVNHMLPNDSSVEKVILAEPRGFCAGVDRAVEAVRSALRAFGAPLHVRHQIVHNRFVLEALEREGAIFVEDLDEVPEGQRVIFSAHGVAPREWERARARRLRVMDATCPLVTKVHSEVDRYAGEGRTVILVGHAGHEEVKGTLGVAPGKLLLVGTVEEAEALD